VSATPDKRSTDNELLEQFRKDGNNRWLGVLLQRYTLLLFGLCMKYMKNEEEARDCVQQIFLKALTEIPRYRIDYFKSWLYTMSRNHCLMRLRDKGRLPAELPETLAGPAPEHEQAEKGLRQLREERLTKLETAIEELPTEQRACIRLFYLEKKSYQDVSTVTGFSYMQVKSYIQNGKRNLRIMLEKTVTPP
jgi:RNA polymerase sigma factor (sigma-70 family)